MQNGEKATEEKQNDQSTYGKTVSPVFFHPTENEFV